MQPGDILYGRGAVDAKGPLATFVAAGAALGDAWARSQDLRLVVVGAVEEEYATSKGARAIAARFDGVNDRIPDACVIGEPSSWQRVTLGYKGRLLGGIDGAPADGAYGRPRCRHRHSRGRPLELDRRLCRTLQCGSSKGV